MIVFVYAYRCKLWLVNGLIVCPYFLLYTLLDTVMGVFTHIVYIFSYQYRALCLNISIFCHTHSSISNKENKNLSYDISVVIHREVFKLMTGNYTEQLIFFSGACICLLMCFN